MMILLRAAKAKLRNMAMEASFALEGISRHTLQIVRPDAAQQEAMENNNHLAACAKNVASQGGEDGVIEQIMNILGFTSPGWCVEFGACDGKTDSNTWNLVKNHGWKAVYVEPEPTFFQHLQKHCAQTPGTYCFNDFVGWDGDSSLTNILARTPIPKEFEFMAVDIDGNDYYVWEALEAYRPHVVCIEFHRLIGTSVDYVQPRDPSLNHPASIRSLTTLAKRKGYELVCVVNWNLFFVRSEHFAKFKIADNRPEAMYYPHEEMRLIQGYDGTLILFGNRNHYWKYLHDDKGVITNIQISHHDIQVLPDGMRIFRPRHTYLCKTMEAQAGKLEQLPGNPLLAHRKNITSECGEDGILAHIFSQLQLPEAERFCVDLGAGDGTRWSNSKALLTQPGWRGLLVEKDADQFAALTKLYSGNSAVACVESDASSHNLSSLLERNKVPQRFGLLTIDVEGNDYHLWSACRLAPAVVVIDFNASISNDVLFIQENDPDTHYGASLYALLHLARKKGYALAALTDWNAIFVRTDAFTKLGMPEVPLSAYQPPFEMRMFQTLDGCVHLSGCKTLVRQDFAIDWEDFQVIPKKFRGRDNSFANFGKMRSVLYDD